jgi:hypothetical protein
MRAIRWTPTRSLLLGMLPLAACTTHHAPPVVVAEAPPPVALAVPLPPGATPGMLVPHALADGSFPTPNRGLTGDAAIWHLRSGLNVAALSCPGEEGAAIRAGYNGWLQRDKAVLARVATGYAAQYRGGASTYDDAMTRLYNFFSQTPVRPALCTAAAAIVAQMPATAAALPEFAAARLVVLDQPFTDFYRAYDAWRMGALRRPVIATAAVTPTAPPAAMVVAATPHAIAPHAATPHAAARPALTLDLSSLPADEALSAGR